MVMQIPDDPREMGVPHSTWRPGQKSALQSALDTIERGEKSVFIAELPTGTGKSGLAAALGHDDTLTVLVHTVGLGQQYEQKYGIPFLAGKPNHRCVFPDNVEKFERMNVTATADDCCFTKMDECPCASQCPYLIKKAEAMASQKMVCTVPYAMLSQRVISRPGRVAIDEFDTIVENLLGFTEVTISQDHIDNYDLPQMPWPNAMSPNGFGPGGEGGIVEPAHKVIISAYIGRCIKILSWTLEPERVAIDPLGARAKRLFERLLRLRENMLNNDIKWFMKCNNSAARVYRGGYARTVPGMFLRALSPAGVASKLWSDKSFVLGMSATIGDPSPLMEQLGLAAGTYEHISLPHPVPVAYRPIHDLHFPKMTFDALSKNEGLYGLQARTIAQWIRNLDPAWRGIVLTSSNKKVDYLVAHLDEELPGRVLHPRRVSKGSQARNMLTMFLDDRRPGLILIWNVQGLGHGIDLFGEEARFAVAAGVPIVSPVDPYEKARKHAGYTKHQDHVAYMTVPQGLSRVSRGEVLSNGDWMLNEAAIADGIATTPKAMRIYPTWTKEAII